MNNQFDIILESVYTKEEANGVLASLFSLRAVLYEENSVLETVLPQSLPYHVYEKLLSYLQEQKIVSTDRKAMQKMIGDLENYIKNLETITLYIAFAPQEPYIKRISSWLSATCKKKVLIDLYRDRSVLGGAIIAVNGIYKDYSLRRSMHEKYKETDLLKMLDR